MREVKKRCTAKTRTCRKCKHRYVKGDTAEHCPICGEERRCQQGAVKNYSVCTKHGAGSPFKGRPGGRPPKDGIFSHLLPPRMLEAYEAAYEDERLTELRRDIALMEARRADLISKADSGESGRRWRDLQKAWSDYLRALRTNEETDELLRTLNDLVLSGHGETMIWAEIEKVTDDLRKLRVDETRRLKDMQQMISVERLMALVGKIVNVIEATVVERETQNAIAYRIEALLEGNVVEGEWS